MDNGDRTAKISKVKICCAFVDTSGAGRLVERAKVSGRSGGH